jgi:hypothetical protein
VAFPYHLGIIANFSVLYRKYYGGTVHVISNDVFYVDVDISSFYNRLYFVRSKVFE